MAKALNTVAAAENELARIEELLGFLKNRAQRASDRVSAAAEKAEDSENYGKAGQLDKLSSVLYETSSAIEDCEDAIIAAYGKRFA